MDYYIQIPNRVYVNMFWWKKIQQKYFLLIKWIKSIKNAIAIKHNVFNDFTSHKVTYFLCLINEFRLYAWEKLQYWN
jgi:hypothetical protein